MKFVKPVKLQDRTRPRRSPTLRAAASTGLAFVWIAMIGGSGAFARSRASAGVPGIGSTLAAPDTALLQRMLDAEDARATDSAGLAPIVEGSRSSDVETRRIAARAIGRMERRENLPVLEA